VRTLAERARRFDLHLSLRYRSVGAKRWRQGRIENISCSGVLFWTDQPLEVDTPLEMSFVLPFPRRPPDVVCRGRIVRRVQPSRGDGHAGVAATIAAYRFVRGRSASV
jgi:hypothetical protein